MQIRSMVESDLGRILTCLETQSVNTTTPERFNEFLTTRAYRPEWTWLAVEGEQILALSVWWGLDGYEKPFALDCLYADESVVEPSALWADLLRQMVDQFEPEDEQPEYHLFLSTEWRSDPKIQAEVEPRLAAAAAVGLTGLTERLRFEWTAAEGLPDRSSRLTFRAEPDDEAFVDVLQRVAKGTLDASTARAVVRIGAEGAAREELETYRSLPGDRAWWRLAYNAENELIGFAIPSANNGGPVVGYLGILPEHRGHRYVDDLLAEITHILAETGAEVIRADTDFGNVPMAAAFERAGYQHFATRLVASHPGG
ncbi:GNAT family N-acetyltransferase [Kribbella deserti]|uniref:GNAT family N-acetyltransferase n=1 Tax=Kribbella deserti TaxID=1926257 RepID=A0ABV6QW48_9ACTN